MSYEKTQNGNPHSLTIKQHILPAASIKRYGRSDGRVEVYLKPEKKCVLRKPTSPIFCAKRVWDQLAESGFMKAIEDKFQSLAEEIIKGNVISIASNQKMIVDDFFALWHIRVLINSQPIQDQRLQGILGGSQNFTKDEEERMEKIGVVFIRSDGTILGRQLAGGGIQINIFKWRKQLTDTKWGILRVSKGEFIIPDDPGGYGRIVPLSPTLCLFSPSEDSVITDTEATGLNRLAVESSKNYYFGRNLSLYPK